jgi:hypothetical protein
MIARESPMTQTINRALLDYAERLLTGTGLHGPDAEAVANGERFDVPGPGHAAAAALRDGWTAADASTGAA